MDAQHGKKQIDDETADINDVFHSIVLSEERLMKRVPGRFPTRIFGRRSGWIPLALPSRCRDWRRNRIL